MDGWLQTKQINEGAGNYWYPARVSGWGAGGWDGNAAFCYRLVSLSVKRGDIVQGVPQSLQLENK